VPGIWLAVERYFRPSTKHLHSLSAGSENISGHALTRVVLFGIQRDTVSDEARFPALLLPG